MNEEKHPVHRNKLVQDRNEVRALKHNLQVERTEAVTSELDAEHDSHKKFLLKKAEIREAQMDLLDYMLGNRKSYSKDMKYYENIEGVIRE